MNLKKQYSRDDFLIFLKEFLPGFRGDVRSASTKGLKATQEAHYLGECEELNLSVFELISTSSTQARVTLALDGFRVLKNYAVYRALVVFKSATEDSWRLSLMTASPIESEAGVALALSHPRRYSYFLGPSAMTNTPNKFLIKLGVVKDFHDLQNRFSLEVVNKEFYQKVSESFKRLVGGSYALGKDQALFQALLRLPSTQDNSRTNLEFAVRLIGRIIFCWFLREKKSAESQPLIPRELLSLEAVAHYKGYYHSVLEPIFFEVLNKPLSSRKEQYAGKLFSLVPYLNGGLFSPQENDFFSYTADRQAQNLNTVSVPDEWFTTFFETLETYNFTIDENTSFDEELSIDPEMLGRIFENLLAEINPETGETARKSTGSYYTPRLIVDYMVDESLFLYLKARTGIEEKALKALISYDLTDDEDVSLSAGERTKVIDSLEKLKLLDPACGSGAFPIGALQKILFVLQQVDPGGQLWFRKQIKTTTPEIRRVIEKKFENQNFDYIRKLGIIRENIYGVDIQPIATEISRLRCFLTLVVDEKVDDLAENRGIEPLPNLDFKFVTGNSLKSLPSTDDQQVSLFDDFEKINELKMTRDHYFAASGLEREQLKTLFVTQQKRLIEELIKEHGFIGIVKAELSQKLADWEPFSHEGTDWFDSEWMFGIKNGFDIVIANPPYIDSEAMVNSGEEEFRKYIVENYKFAKGNWDIYVAFFEKGIDSLGRSGVLTFISPDKWISKPFGRELRKNTLKFIYSILNAGRKVFQSAQVDSLVTIFEKVESNSIRVLKMTGDSVSFLREFEKKEIEEPFTLDFLFSDNLPLLQKIDSTAAKRGKTKIHCENACATSDAYKLAPLIYNGNGKTKNHELKVVNTGTVGKFVSKWGYREMKYLGNKYLFPNVDIKKFDREFHNTYSRKSVQPKLIVKGLTLLDACIDEVGNVIPGKSTLVILDENLHRLKLLLAFINCPVFLFYLKEKYPASSYNQGTTFTKEMLNNLPIPALNTAEENKILQIVESILELGKQPEFYSNDESQSRFETQFSALNQIIYNLLGLNESEISIIEA